MTDFTITRGDDRVLAGVATQQLTDAILFFTAKVNRHDTDDQAVITKELDAGIEIVDENAGTFEVTIDAADTDDLDTPLLLLWDLQGIDSIDKVRTLASGRLLVQPDITRRTETLAS